MAFEIVMRKAQILSGTIWEGSYEEAGAGEVKKTIAEMEHLRGRLAGRAGSAAGGLIGISWNDRPGGFRYLVALPPTLTEQGEAEGLAVYSFPEMQFATAWHDAANGDVFEHYRHMFAWIEESGLERSVEIIHHREEYPAGLDLGDSPRLRLMTPIAA